MRILAIHPGHNANVGFFEDGQARSIYHEEKFNNIKSCVGFPMEALRFLGEKVPFSSVDSFVIPSTILLSFDVAKPYISMYESMKGGSLTKRIIETMEYKAILREPLELSRTLLLQYYFSRVARGQAETCLEKEFGVPKEKIQWLDHHFAHNLTPIFFFGLNKLKTPILLMSLDGAGDFSCAKIYIYDPMKTSMTLIANSRYDASIGLLYSRVTKLLGMKSNEHEYKTMGLAAYVSEPKYYQKIYELLRSLVWLDPESLTFKSKFNMYTAHHYLRRELKFERFDNIAAAVQKLTEELVKQWILEATKKTGISTVALSGGVFMNVKMNQKIAQMPQIHKLYIQPSCGDESLVIGAAAHEFMKHNVPLKPIKTMFLGHTYTNSEVKNFLTKNKYFKKYKITRVGDIERVTAKLLAKYEIVARFKGPGEWGARSLCNRAILGNAKDLKTFYQVNDMIKMRDFWMPFAPTIKVTWAPRYIDKWKLYKRKCYESTKYMIMTFNSTLLAQDHLRAAIHQKDKTLRPQIVDEKDNKDLYRLLTYYEKLTGMGGLMNTSLNLHGYPLVGTLEQAMFTFENSGLRYMTLENYLIKK